MNCSSAFKTVEKICVHSEVCLKPAEALAQAEKSYECEAAHDFLELLSPFLHSQGKELTPQWAQEQHFLFKINSSKITYSHLRNRFLN